MGLLGGAVTVEGRTGRKVSNALTLTFKVGEGLPLAVATQGGGIGVLLGFKNGGSKGHFKLTGPGGVDVLDVDCTRDRTTVTRADGAVVGTIVEDGGGNASFRSAAGDV